MYTVDRRIIAKLRRALPRWVKNVELRDSTDESGDSVLVVMLIVEAGVVQDAARLAAARRIVSNVFSTQGIAEWPYVRFISEQDWSKFT